jgi:hypothetical protein
MRGVGGYQGITDCANRRTQSDGLFLIPKFFPTTNVAIILNPPKVFPHFVNENPHRRNGRGDVLTSETTKKSERDRSRTCTKSMCVSSPMGLPRGFPHAIARSSVCHFATRP